MTHEEIAAKSQQMVDEMMAQLRAEDARAEEAKNEAPDCEDCGEEMFKDCMGKWRCEQCDSPCPHCFDDGF